MANYKGIVMDGFRKIVRDRGEKLEKQLLDTLSEEEKRCYLVSLPVSWCSLEELAPKNNLWFKIATLLYPQDKRPIERLAYESGLMTFSGLYKLLFRISSVESLVKQFGKLWNRYFDMGMPSVENLEKNKLDFVVSNFPGFPLACQENGCGTMRAMLEVSGATNVRITCSAQPDTVTWHLEWE